ncbi:hypothetical protein QZH41_020627, partial [Actinostola sp. cb2023]
NAQGKYQKDNLLGPLKDFLLQHLEPLMINVPNARIVFAEGTRSIVDVTCIQRCRSLWNPVGRWVNGNTWIPYFSAGKTQCQYSRYLLSLLLVKHLIGFRVLSCVSTYHLTSDFHYTELEPMSWPRVHHDVTPSGILWIYGDSVAKNLVLSARKRALCNQLYKRCEFSYNWIYPVLAGEQRAIILDDNLDFEEDRVLNTMRELLTHPDMNDNPNSTLLLNIGLHFVMTLNFTTYQKFIDHVIYMLSRPGDDFESWYKAKVIWKTTTAIYKENAKEKNSTHFRFLTSQRILLFNAYSTWAMCKAGITVVDVHPITDSYPYGPIDVVHYYGFVTYTLEQRLEQYKLNGQQGDQLTKMCIDSIHPS